MITFFKKVAILIYRLIRFFLLYVFIPLFLFNFFVLMPIELGIAKDVPLWRLSGGLIVLYTLIVWTIQMILVNFSSIYGFTPKNLLWPLHRQRWKQGYLGPFESTVISFLLTIHCFAIIYLAIGNHFDGFKEKEFVKLNYLDCLYFSLTTMTVGPSGMNPTTALSKVIVMIQVLMNVVYTVLVFSVIASMIRKSE